MADSAAANELKEVEDIDVEYEPVEVQNNRAVNAQVEDMDEQNVEEQNAEEQNAEELEDRDNSAVSSIQIAPTDATSELEYEFNPMLFIQLGDRILIDSKKYGRTIGTVYYRSLEYIRIKPDGVSNTLHSFEVYENDGEEVYKEEDGVTLACIIEKRIYQSFVEQQDFRIHQIVDTFDSNGDTYKTYKLTKVDKERDSITIQDAEDPDQEYDIAFNFTGIESDENFTVISIRQLVSNENNDDAHNNAPLAAKYDEDEDENEDNKDNKNKQDEEDEEEGEEEEQEDGEVKIIGFIELIKPKIYREAASYEEKIPDNLQKIDALNDFIMSLDTSLQKDPKALRNIRILIETLFNLKQAITKYRADGSIEGPQSTSVSTLTELIHNVHVPLGRPVLNVSKKLYDLESDEKYDPDTVYFEEFESELEQIIKNHSNIVSSVVKGSTIIREWSDQQNFTEQYETPFSLLKGDPQWKAIVDSEFFRESPPSLDDENEFTSSVPGYTASHSPDAPPIFNDLPFAIERALSITYRKGNNRQKQVLHAGEQGTLHSYILFPMRAANYIGNKRSTSLAMDSGRSQLPPKTMEMLLRDIGSPKEIGTSNDAILLSVSGTTLGNIPLADYIDGISIPSLGLGDAFATLEQYGIDNLELNYDLVTVIQKKIELYQNQLISSLAALRQIIDTEHKEKEPIQNPFIENVNFLQKIRTLPILSDDFVEYDQINPTLALSDIGIVNHLMQKHANHFQIAIGQNSLLMAKATLHSQRMTYLNQLHIANIINKNEMNKHQRPMKNRCTHVANLVSIRKISNDAERFQELTRFFRKYQGTREHNWINCNSCKEHLLCMHERLQLQAYLNPKEKDTIDKEVILTLSGGQFQGKYICRNCGQSIKDFDFDNNIEFDDNGKPKSGRAVLVDEDAIFEDKLDLLVSVPIEPSEKSTLQLDEDETKCYNIIRILSETVGIYIATDDYKRMIQRIIRFMNTLPSREEYAIIRKSRPKMVDYETTLARNIINVCAAHLLIAIQTKMPSYVVRYTMINCKSPGFNGYPLDSDPKNMQGIEYIACAISSTRRNDTPWTQTGFYKIADDAQRQKGIVALLFGMIKEIIIDDMIQSELSNKKKYIINIIGKTGEDIKGYGEIARDNIHASFLPEQVLITPEEAAKNVITPEVAQTMGNKGRVALVKLWIRQAHMMAKETASLTRGSPIMETTCCLSTIEKPGTFWLLANQLPSIGKRLLTPNHQGKFLISEFIPREAGSDVTEPDKDLYYRLFLKCCFQGPRIGHSHEPGLTHKCTWCGFQFPTNPSIMDTDTEGKSSLASQDVKTDTEEFTQLLDTIHVVNKVDSIQMIEGSSTEEVMLEFGNIAYPPLPGWANIIEMTTNTFLELPPNANVSDIAIAAGPISEITYASQQLLDARLPEAYRKILKMISELSWINFFQVLQNYFLVPFQRILTSFSTDSLFVPVELIKSLSVIHVESDIKPILQKDMELLIAKVDIVNKPSFKFARAKLEYFNKQISALLPYKNKIRPIVLPGKEATLIYIQRALLYGPLATLINPDSIPPGMLIEKPMKSVGNPSIKSLLEIIAFTLDKYNKEKLSYNEQEIKELIAIRDEKERVNVVAEFNKLTDEERGMELMNKSLGLGKWAVGGTKKIYAYDKEYYDQERQKRLAAGIVDFPGLGNGEMGPPEGREMDELGFPVYNDKEFEEDGGYDHNQHADDDQE